MLPWLVSVRECEGEAVRPTITQGPRLVEREEAERSAGLVVRVVGCEEEKTDGLLAPTVGMEVEIGREDWRRNDWPSGVS